MAMVARMIRLVAMMMKICPQRSRCTPPCSSSICANVNPLRTMQHDAPKAHAYDAETSAADPLKELHAYSNMFLSSLLHCRVSPEQGDAERGRSAHVRKGAAVRQSPPDPLEPWSTRELQDINKILAKKK